MKLGIVTFANDSGLGNQTRRLTQMLKPHRILLINSTGFSKNKQMNKEWYEGFSGYIVGGFPNNHEIKVFLNGLTHVLVCENPLNFFLIAHAKQLGVKTYIQSNYEFCDNLSNPQLPIPDKFLMPSFWHVQTMKDKFGNDKVDYLPPPIDPNEFQRAREINFKRAGKLKLLHIIGTLAVNDRNGTLDLLASLPHTSADFTLTIRSQHDLPEEYLVNDRRVNYQIGNIKDCEEMYIDFDALILPRRYGGLSMTTNEAMMSGLPVIMPDISPNNELLPKEWLFPSFKKGSFMTRTSIDIHGSNPKDIANKIDWLVEQNLAQMKVEAFDCGYFNFTPSTLKPLYESLW